MSDTSSDEEYTAIFTLALWSETEEKEKYMIKRQWIHAS